jgi:hypothetical protein
MKIKHMIFISIFFISVYADNKELNLAKEYIGGKDAKITTIILSSVSKCSGESGCIESIKALGKYKIQKKDIASNKVIFHLKKALKNASIKDAKEILVLSNIIKDKKEKDFIKQRAKDILKNDKCFISMQKADKTLDLLEKYQAFLEAKKYCLVGSFEYKRADKKLKNILKKVKKESFFRYIWLKIKLFFNKFSS